MKNTKNSNPETSCPYTKTKQKISDFIDYITIKIIKKIGIQDTDDYEKITFKSASKQMGLQDISYKIPQVDSKVIDDFYHEIMAMSETDREAYTKPFFTLEGFYKESHLKYSRMQWLLMESIIHDIMDELIQNIDGENTLNLDEFDDEKWLEIGKDTDKFESSLLDFFKVKIYNKLIDCQKSDKNSDIYKLFEIIFSTNKSHFLDLLMSKGIRNSISNLGYMLETAIDGIYHNDEVISFNKLEQCLLQNSNQLLVDLSRSGRFLEEIVITQKKHFYYNKKENKIEFSLLQKNIESFFQTNKYPFNQYIGCPMLHSKSKIFGKKSNKIIDFSKIIIMCYLEFYKHAIPQKNKIKNNTINNI